jgi:hypothetical protein
MVSNDGSNELLLLMEITSICHVSALNCVEKCVEL